MYISCLVGWSFSYYWHTVIPTTLFMFFFSLSVSFTLLELCTHMKKVKWIQSPSVAFQSEEEVPLYVELPCTLISTSTPEERAYIIHN